MWDKKNWTQIYSKAHKNAIDRTEIIHSTDSKNKLITNSSSIQ